MAQEIFSFENYPMTSLVIFLLTITLVGLLTSFMLMVHLRITAHGLTIKKNVLEKQLAEAKQALTQLQAENIDLKEHLTALQVRKETLQQYLTDQEKKATEDQQKLLFQFQNLSNKLLEQKSEKFTHLNKIELEKVLKPLAEKIYSFEQEVARTHREALNHKVALRTELERMHTLNTRMSQEAHNLTQAIKGDNKVQGPWGEFILESILENAGLVKGREYVVQHSFTDAEGKRRQPDVIITLPQDKSIVIDAKVSLKDYEQYFHAKDDKNRALFLQKHLAALKRHVKTLHEKNYAQTYDLKSLDFVLMFIPLEPAFTLALQQDPSLFQKAYHQNVILASPSTLLVTLRTIAHVWKREYQSQYAAEIAQQSGALYDKFVSFVEDLRKIGLQLTTTQKVYQSALNKLSEGKGNLISKAERIKALGARTKKQLNPPPNTSS